MTANNDYFSVRPKTKQESHTSSEIHSFVTIPVIRNQKKKNIHQSNVVSNLGETDHARSNESHMTLSVCPTSVLC